MNIETLDTAGFVTLPRTPAFRTAVDDALGSWKRFCALPMEKKRLLSGGDRIRDFGYMKREDKGANADDKELFHSLRAKRDELLAKAELIDDDAAIEFIIAIDQLIGQMKPVVNEFADGVERRYTVAGFTREVMESWDWCTFRFLLYPKSRPMLANAHPDRGGFSFHLTETEGGGEYLDLVDRKWKAWPLTETQTIIFPSMGLQFRSQCKLKALWHRVKPMESLATERLAMVAFIDPQFSHRFDDAKYRTQDLVPGSTYGMSFKEFAKYFVPRKEMVPG